MSFSIAWTSEAFRTFEERIEYLTIHWTDKEINNFKQRVTKYLSILNNEPFIGKKADYLNNVYSGLIIKEVSLIYRVKIVRKEIELIAFIDNRQNPKKFRKYKS